MNFHFLAVTSVSRMAARVIAPFAPGGGADFMGRLTGQHLSDAVVKVD